MMTLMLRLTCDQVVHIWIVLSPHSWASVKASKRGAVVHLHFFPLTSFSGAPMRAVHWPHVFFEEKKDIIKVGLYFDLRKS